MCHNSRHKYLHTLHRAKSLNEFILGALILIAFTVNCGPLLNLHAVIKDQGVGGYTVSVPL